jgi:hypothetical protein
MVWWVFVLHKCWPEYSITECLVFLELIPLLQGVTWHSKKKVERKKVGSGMEESDRGLFEGTILA